MSLQEQFSRRENIGALIGKEIEKLHEIRKRIRRELSKVCQIYLEGRQFLPEFLDLILGDLEHAKALDGDTRRFIKQFLCCIEMGLHDNYLPLEIFGWLKKGENVILAHLELALRQTKKSL